MVHSILYNWTGNIVVKAPGEYEFWSYPEPGWDLLPSRMTTLKAASLIMFGYSPKPKQVVRELERKWLPRGTSVRYVTL